jgi:hypothetical protein
MSDKTEAKEICIKGEEYDGKNLVIDEPETMEFLGEDGKTPIKSCSSKGFYRDAKGNKCTLYLLMPRQSCFGFNLSAPLGQTVKPDHSNLKGIQVCVPMTSLKTVANPTNAEKANMTMLDSMRRTVAGMGYCETMKRKKQDRKVPQTVVSQFVAACQDVEKGSDDSDFIDAAIEAVKPPFAYAKKDTVVDTSKPQRFYVKLLTKGKGEKLRVYSKIYGPGDRLINPLDYVDKRGDIVPVVRFDGVYWGAHGSDSPFGASLKFTLVDANYTPGEDLVGLPSQRYLPKNSDVETTSTAIVSSSSSSAPLIINEKKKGNWADSDSDGDVKNPMDELSKKRDPVNSINDKTHKHGNNNGRHRGPRDGKPHHRKHVPSAENSNDD